MKPNLFLETIRCDGGRAHHLDYHQQRLNTTLRCHGHAATYILADLITPPDGKLYRCRFVYDHESYNIEYHPYTPRRIKSLRVIQADALAYPFKYENRNELNSLFELRQESDDILFLQHGRITDTTIANVAFWINEQWLTPDTPLLRGTTRQRLLDQNFISPAPISLDDAFNAPKIALMNAMIGFFEMDNVIIS